MPKRLLVDDDQLIALLEAGYKPKEILRISNEITGNNATLGAVYRALSRLGRSKKIRYDDTLPWPKIPDIKDHGNSHTAHLLRAQGRRVRGLPLPERTRADLDAWEEYMDNTRQVVEYIYIADADEENPAGFRYQYWQPSDGDNWTRLIPLPPDTPPEPVPFPVDRRSKYDDPEPTSGQWQPESVWDGGLFSGLSG